MIFHGSSLPVSKSRETLRALGFAGILGAGLDLALEFENTLALEMARYGEFEKRLPGEEGFIDPSQRRAWENRLLGRKRESDKAAARVRLIARDMKDLLGKVSLHGFIPPTNQSGKSINPVSDPVIP